MFKLRQILVPIDFSDPSWLALTQAADLAKLYAAQVDVIHVWELPAFVSAEEVEPGAGLPPGVVDAISGQAHLALARFMEDAKARGIPIRNARTVPGAPFRTISEIAEHGGYDLIVLGTHGRTKLARVLLGSVAERVVRYAPCPVLIARPQVSN